MPARHAPGISSALQQPRKISQIRRKSGGCYGGYV
jgi:hypothetical protein